MASLHVSLVERNIMVSVYWVPGIAMVVVRKDTRLEIVVPLLLKEEKVSKFLLVFRRMMLQQRGVSMHSGLEEKSRMVMVLRVSPCFFLFSDMSSF